MKRYAFIFIGLAVATASVADANRYLPQPQHPIERPMPAMATPSPTPWVRGAPTGPNSAIIVGGKGNTTGVVEVGPRGVGVGVSTQKSHDLLGK